MVFVNGGFVKTHPGSLKRTLMLQDTRGKYQAVEAEFLLFMT